MANREKGPSIEAEEEEISRFFLEIMEGYKDSVVPKLSEISPLKRMAVLQMGSTPEKRSRKLVSDAEYILRERERRDKLAESFSVLQSVVPGLLSTPKATRDKIVEETIRYIKNLEEETQRLEGLKKSLIHKQNESSNPLLCHCIRWNPSVTVSYFNGFALLAIKLMLKKGLLSKIFGILEENLGGDVVVSTICVDDHGILTLMAKFNLKKNGGTIIEKIKKEIQSI